MLGRSYIAQKIRAVGRCHSAADCRCYMVITGSNIGDNRPENIERGVVAKSLLKRHICSNLIYRHMTRTFHQNLNIPFPGPLCQIANFD